MSKKFSTILIAAALILVAALLLMPGSATASQLLGITITPAFTPETPIATTPVTEEPGTDTPTPSPTATEVPTDTPTPTAEVKPPTSTAKPKATELVLLPETGEYPIDPQQGLQWIFAIALLLLIGGIFLRAVEGSQKQD
jgi:outer membrane biosynthesis protein TonB